MPILYIMCGPSGCGKTTYARKIIQKQRETDDIRYVSRDEIRYELVDPNEEYFSREKEVFRRFVGVITQTLVDGFDIIADATHLNEFSRRKLTQAIDMLYTDYQIIYVDCSCDVEECLRRNQNRPGRANVPENVIRNMCRDFRAPRAEEDERVIKVMKVEEL